MTATERTLPADRLQRRRERMAAGLRAEASAPTPEQRLRSQFEAVSDAYGVLPRSRQECWEDFAHGCGEELWVAFWRASVGGFADLLGCWLDEFGNRLSPAVELGVGEAQYDRLVGRLATVGVVVPATWT